MVYVLIEVEIVYSIYLFIEYVCVVEVGIGVFEIDGEMVDGLLVVCV